jgi:hypothetical protein
MIQLIISAQTLIFDIITIAMAPKKNRWAATHQEQRHESGCKTFASQQNREVVAGEEA